MTSRSSELRAESDRPIRQTSGDRPAKQTANDKSAQQTAATEQVENHQLDEDTLFAMGAIYCRGHHRKAERNARGVCPKCAQVIEYSLQRTKACPHGHKGTCKNCTIHCYKPEMRTAIQEIMRYSGPRMAYRHPALMMAYLRKKLSKNSH